MSFLPPSNNAHYRGHPAAAWFLTLCGVMTIVPGLIHSFAPAGGAIAIAGLELGDQARLVRGLPGRARPRSPLVLACWR
jgi:hypothetical protein